MKICLDLDEVTVKFLEELCNRYNIRTGNNLKPHQITEWNLTNSIGKENLDIFQSRDFFASLKPFPNAIEEIKSLQDDGFNIIIATNHMFNQEIKLGKLEWIERYLPFIYDVYFGDKKYELKADLIFDDCPKFLRKFPGIKIANDRPYNKNVNTDFRIYNNDWKYFGQLVREIGSEKWNEELCDLICS